MAITNFSWVIPDKLAGAALPGKHAFDEGALISDISALAESGITILVSLVKPDGSIGEICRQHGIIWRYFPISDFSVPEDENAFDKLIKEIVEFIDKGDRVCINCYAGVGRTGLVLSCVVGRLYALSGEKAIAVVRKSRSAIDTVEQEVFINNYLGEYEQRI